MAVPHAARLLGAILLFAAATASGQSVTGTATYRERVTLPADSVFEATLEASPRDAGKAALLGRTRIESPGPPPIRFEIPYDRAAIQADGRYVVRARVLADGQVLWVAERPVPVLGPGQGRHAEIVMRRAPGTGTR